MTAAAPVIGNLFLSLAALAGLFIVQGVLSARDPWAPLNRRFLFGLRVLIVLFAGRALVVITGNDAFRLLVLLGAALIPLAVLLLAEGLLRRHAPLWAKTLIGGGTLVFGLSAFWWSSSIDPARLVALLVFQTGGLTLGGWLVLTRDKASLSTAENKMAERVALSLLLLIPMAAADFLVLYLGLPAQISSLGVLFMCWLVVSLGRSESQHRAPLVSFLVIVLAAGLSAGFVALMTGMNRDGAILSLAVILAAVMVAVLFIEARALRAEDRSQTLLRYLAEDRSPDALSFLRGLQSHPLVGGAVVIDPAQLADLDATVLARIFAAAPVLRVADPPFTSGAEHDHIAHLFRLFDASHILIVDDGPLLLVALSMPALGLSQRAELELAVVQRMAWLMTRGARG